MSRRKNLTLLVIFIIALILVVPAAAQEPLPSDDEVNAIAKQLYCPVCENIPLDVCPTQACVQWRQTIREKLVAGWDEAQIKTYFVEQYGDRVLAEPPRRGFNWLIYIIPPLAFLGGAVILYRALRAWQAVPAEGPVVVDETPAADKYIRRLEAELEDQYKASRE
jgi:cytochrome c-type biogenesis protein CcmH